MNTDYSSVEKAASNKTPQSEGICSQDHQAYLIMIIAGLFFVAGTSLAAENHSLNIGSISYWRGLSTVVFNFLIVRYSGKPITFTEPYDFQLLNKRNFMMLLQGLAISLALYYLPPSTVHTINSSGPVMVFLMDYFRNGTSVSQRQLIGIVIGFLSILITVNSNYIMHSLGYDVQMDSRFKYIQSSIAVKSAVSFILFLVQIGMAYGVVVTKELHNQDAFQIGYHFGIMLVIAGAFVNFFYDQPAITFWETWDILLKVSLLLGIANIGLTLALKMCHKSGNISMLMFLNVVTGYMISLFRYGESPNTIALIGSGCIFLSLLLVLIK